MVVTLALALSSCGLFKKTTKIETAVKVKASDSSHVAIRKTDSSATNKITTREKVDTTITIPGSTQNGSKDLDDLKDGDSLVLDDEDQRTVIEYDQETGRIKGRSTVKDRSKRIQVDRETVNETAVDISRESADATHVTKQDIDATQKKDTSTKVRVGPDWAMWAGLYIAIGLILLAVLLFYRRKFGNFFR